jgi:hypothetical protein
MTRGEPSPWAQAKLVVDLDPKEELAHDLPGPKHCREALAAALAWYGSRNGAFTTRRHSVARLFWSLLDENHGASPARSAAAAQTAQRISIGLPGYLANVPSLPAPRCDRLMEIRGAFLACGTLALAASGYHLEFTPIDNARMRRLLGLLDALGFAAKHATRRGRAFIYSKDFETIVRLMAGIGAHATVLTLEDVRALRETKNRVRRLVNSEAANVERSTSAAAEQRKTIEYLARAWGLRRLSAPLREIALLRLRFPEESLRELGRRCDPPAGKPTVASRLLALSRLATRLRQGRREGAR